MLLLSSKKQADEHITIYQGSKKPVHDKLDESTIKRKTPAIIDELSQNRDFAVSNMLLNIEYIDDVMFYYQEAEDCIRELESPNLLHSFVCEAVNHSLEKSSSVRICVGKLLDILLKKGILLPERLIAG